MTGVECKESKEAYRREGTLCQHCCTSSSESRTQGLIDTPALAWVDAARVSVAACFPSPAEDQEVERIEIMSHQVRHDPIPGDLVQRAHKIRTHIHRWVGIPTCIGIALTKNLVKQAKHIDKFAERKPGSQASQPRPT